MNTIKILIFALALIFVMHPLSAAQETRAEDYSRIIVKLDVPKIQELTAVSTSFKGIVPGGKFPAQGYEADEALRKAIETTANELLLKLNGKGYNLTRAYDFIPFVSLQVSKTALEFLKSEKSVLGIFEDQGHPVAAYNPVNKLPVSIRSSMGPVDSPGISRPKLDFTAGLVGADSTWNMGWTGAGWYVAVLDSGIRRTHEFFAGKDIVEHCFSGFGHCPNGQTEMDGVGSAAHHPNNYWGWDHGTLTTGIAVGDNGTLSGVAKGADIIAVQVTSRLDQDCYPDWWGTQFCVMDYESDVLAGLDYIYGLRTSYAIAAVNISLGDQVEHTAPCDSDSRFTAISNLRAVGIATVIATGNEKYCNGINAPACISPAIAVGASTDGDQEWDDQDMGSNWHDTMLNLFAPGKLVHTASGISDTSYTNPDLSGTSLAAPHVAGAWALAKDSWSAAPVDDLLNAFIGTGVPVSPIGTTCNTSASASRIQIDDAILFFRGIQIITPVDSRIYEFPWDILIDWDPRAILGNVKIEIKSPDKTIECTKSVSMVIEDSYPADGAPYTWRIPKCFYAGQYNIIITSEEGIVGDSGTFTLGRISITHPVEGQQFKIGENLDTKWTFEGLKYGKLDIHLKSPDEFNKTIYTIALGVPFNQGNYSWTIPALVQPGQYVVEITLDEIVSRSGVITIL